MESFATVVRSLVRRIRALQAAYTADPSPPSATAVAGRSHLYKVRPTSWGLDEEVLPPTSSTPDCPTSDRPAAAIVPEDGELPASTTPIVERRTGSTRWRLELAAHGLPQARGLLTT